MKKKGRPTKYTPEVIVEINKYLQEAVPQNMKIPTVEGIALRLGINRDTLYEWAKQHKDFSDTLEGVKMRQKEMLTEIGIFGGKEINATIVSLLLKVNHDMIEKTALDVTSGGKPIPILGNVPTSNSDPKAPEPSKEG
jgi:hypothetical protein